MCWCFVKSGRSPRKVLSARPLRFAAIAEYDPGLVNALIDLHGARWRAEGEAGTVEGNRAADSLHDAAHALARERALCTATYFREEPAAHVTVRPPAAYFFGAVVAGVVEPAAAALCGVLGGVLDGGVFCASMAERRR